MRELTKSLEIIAKHLSNAFLSMASDFRKLNDLAPLSQASEKPEFVSIKRTMPTKMWTYRPREKVIVKLNGSDSSNRMRILKKVSDLEYLVYPQGGLKSEAKSATPEEILGLDPDR